MLCTICPPAPFSTFYARRRTESAEFKSLADWDYMSTHKRRADARACNRVRYMCIFFLLEISSIKRICIQLVMYHAICAQTYKPFVMFGAFAECWSHFVFAFVFSVRVGFYVSADICQTEDKLCTFSLWECFDSSAEKSENLKITKLKLTYTYIDIYICTVWMWNIHIS